MLPPKDILCTFFGGIGRHPCLPLAAVGNSHIWYRAYQQLLHGTLRCSDGISVCIWRAVAGFVTAAAAWSAALQHDRDLVQNCCPLLSPLIRSYWRWRLHAPISR